MALTHGDVRRILEILEQARNLDHVEITLGDYVLRAGRTAAAMPPAPAPAATAPARQAGDAPAAPDGGADKDADANAGGPTEVEVPAGMVAVRAPMAGTFYLTPGPGEAPFVTEGAEVAEGDTLCLVEVMKMFNSIPAPGAGRVRRIVADHGRPVAMGDVLMIIEPEETA